MSIRKDRIAPLSVARAACPGLVPESMPGVIERAVPATLSFDEVGVDDSADIVFSFVAWWQ
jgi:hypothetical protein